MIHLLECPEVCDVRFRGDLYVAMRSVNERIQREFNYNKVVRNYGRRRNRLPPAFDCKFWRYVKLALLRVAQLQHLEQLSYGLVEIPE